MFKLSKVGQPTKGLCGQPRLVQGQIRDGSIPRLHMFNIYARGGCKLTTLAVLNSMAAEFKVTHCPNVRVIRCDLKIDWLKP